MGYAPNNCDDGGGGRRDAGGSVGLAEKYLEPIPAHAPPPPVTTMEPEQLGERRLVVTQAGGAAAGDDGVPRAADGQPEIFTR